MDVGIYEAKTHFADLVARATRGERITITKHGKPVAELSPSKRHENVAMSDALAQLDASRARLRANPRRRKITAADILAAIREGRR